MLRDPDCSLCPLHAGVRTRCVGVHGSPAPEVLFVGEAPGAEEDDRGLPFVGPAGQLLRQAIEVFGISEHAYAITNAVKCRPPENRTPRVGEVNACFAYLDAEIRALRPKVVVTLGNVALHALTGVRGVTKVAGRPMTFEDRPYIVFPILHPSAVLRVPANKASFETQFQLLKTYLQRGGVAPTLDYERVDSWEAARRLNEIAEKRATFAIDFETTGLNPKFGSIVTCAISTGDRSWWFEWPTARTGLPVALGVLRLAFHNALVKRKCPMVAHNAVFEVKWVLQHILAPLVGGALKDLRRIRWPVVDTMLLHHLLDENVPHHLDYCAATLTDMGGYSDTVDALVAAGTPHHEIPLSTLGPYNAADADVTWRIYQIMRPQISEDSCLERVWVDIVRKTIWSVAWAELYGRHIDLDRVESLRAELMLKERTLRARIMSDPVVLRYTAARTKAQNPLPKGEFNPDSPAQIADVVFRYLKIPKVGKTDSGEPSVRAAYLEPFRKTEPFLDVYLDWKEAQTLLTKYLDKQIRALVKPDGFLYGSYLIHGTVTGRLASREPNLQNFAPVLRETIVSRFPGGQIVEADYSQLELRLMAFAAGCAPLLEAYRLGQDVHRLTASKITGKPIGEVTKDERQNLGKRPNFALLYGASPRRFHMEFGVPLEEAERISEAWHAAYPEVSRFLRHIHRDVMASGSLRSRMGRIRRLPEALSANESIRHKALLMASNFPIQSLGADLTTISMNAVVDRIAASGMDSIVLGSTHDSITLDCPPGEVDAVARMLRTIMVDETAERFPWLTVPLDIEVKAGPSWGTMGVWAEAVKTLPASNDQ
jgi:uracil-DNA glycosylase family 4